VSAGMTRLIQSLALITLIKNLGRHTLEPSPSESLDSSSLVEDSGGAVRFP
jgi:hypothetical protein